MVDRRWPGDLALAVLLVLPFSTLSGREPISHPKTASFLAKINASDRLAEGGRASLIGWS